MAKETAPYFAEGTEQMLALERMVDDVGIGNVLYALTFICRAKAEHIRSNWQDERTAQRWGRVAGIVERSNASVEQSFRR